MIDAPELYDSDPRVRWTTAHSLISEHREEIEAEIAETYVAWPKYWWGVVNPWLVFVGPSPGNSGVASIDWDTERLPTIGEVQVVFNNYDDSAGFWRRMRTWTRNAFVDAKIFPDEPEAALGSVLLANLVPTNEGDSRKIGKVELEAAAPEAVDLLLKLRPRVIVPMDKRISPLLIEEFRNLEGIVNGPVVKQVPAKNQNYLYYKPKAWNIIIAENPILIAESPQHPSKRNFYDPPEVDKYLARILKEADVS